MIITVCGKIMKNLRKRINARVVNNEKDDYEKKQKNVTMKYLNVQRTRDSVFLAHRIFYLSAIDMEKPKKRLPHLQILFTIMNFFS